MNVVICTQPGDLELERRAKPVPGAGEVLVRIRRVGVCGTDMHIFTGNQPYLSYPRVMGHELAGEVEEAPAGSGLAPGDPVYIIPYIACGLAEFLSVPQAYVKKAEGITLEQAAMVEFLAIGAHAVRRGAVVAEQKVLVVGAGPIGIGVALFSKLRGASVTVLDGRADRLAFCADRIGVDSTVTLSESSGSELEQLTTGDFFDVVFDATGNPRAMETGFAYVAHGGTYVLVSIVAADIRFSDPEFHKREMTLMGSRNATAEDFEAVVDAMRAGLVPTQALHTHSSSLAELPQAFPGWLEPSAGVIKAIVSC
jgi:2-desacetyl-2-hydroxyethyl bacteriochlorophyllide A dehydrogenase